MFREFLAYEASAGSGKTFNLVVRYLSLLFMGENPSQIVALTFTNKAANEMLSRVVDTLENLEHKAAELEQISKQTNISSSEILALRDRVLARFLASSIEISTIDKFFGSILRRFAINSAINPNFTVVQKHDSIKLLDRFLLEIESANETEKLLSLMRLTTKRMVNLFDELSYLYAKEFDDYRPIAYGYDRRDEILLLATNLADEVLATDISARGAKTMSIDSYEDLLEKSWIFKDSLNYWDYKKIYKPSMDEKLKSIQSLLYEQMRYDESSYLGSMFVLLNIYKKAREKLLKADATLSFDDITLTVHSLLRGKIDSEFLYFRLDSNIKHILLDEFQDTSILQFDILSPIIDELTSGLGANERRSLFFVGDVKQSIYRFRGGMSELFYYVANRYGVDVEPLAVNYRSSKTVVEFVNELFITKIENYTPQHSFSDNEGYIEIKNSDEPLDAMLDMIKNLVENGTDIDDITILTVTNSDSTQAKEKLLENSYSAQTEATIKLIEQKNIRLVIEYFKYCYFGEDIYKYSVLAMLGISEIERKSCDNLLDVAVWFFDKFNIGDENSLIFIEILSRFRDLEQFVFEIELLEEPSFMPRGSGIRVMTIHKSKGLEFEHVIVLDRLGQKSSSKNPLIYQYDGIRLTDIFLRIKNRDSIDERYKNALELEQVASHKDHLNALYVAFTRSVSSLFIIQKQKSSYFEPLELEPRVIGQLNITTKAPPIKRELEIYDYKALSFGHQELEIKSKELHNTSSIKFGLALHYTLEVMGGFDKQSLHIALYSTKNRYGNYLNSDDFDEIQKRLTNLINDDFFQSLIDGTIYKEQMIKESDEIGVIDLLIKRDDRWIIVDYKSGVFDDEHISQVTRYANIINKLDDKDVYGYICYINSDEVKWKTCL